jgi:hypothetical protein
MIKHFSAKKKIALLFDVVYGVYHIALKVESELLIVLTYGSYYHSFNEYINLVND